jgi:adenosine deaminase
MKDLHLHLSGATSPVLLFEMICETGIKIKERNYWRFLNLISMKKDEVNSLDDYIKIVQIIDETQSSPRAVELSFFDSYKNSFLAGCDYLELRWNPFKRSQNFKIDLDKLIVSARSGFEKANSIFGIDGGMILCMGRDCTAAQNEGIFKKAIQHHKRGVIGIDVAGPEDRIPLKPEFEEYYRMANALGLITTIHCGEPYYEGVEDTMATVLEKYKPQRIGHGIQIHRFPELMKKASSMGIIFEICMSSNLMTKSVKKKEDFLKIFKAFEEYNINYVICSDNLFSIRTTIADENAMYNELIEFAKKK